MQSDQSVSLKSNRSRGPININIQEYKKEPYVPRVRIAEVERSFNDVHLKTRDSFDDDLDMDEKKCKAEDKYYRYKRGWDRIVRKATHPR